jgi:hypothetical protein
LLLRRIATRLVLRILDGVPDEDHYGLFCSLLALFLRPMVNPGLGLARLADLPADVIAESKRTSGILATLDAKQREDSQTTRIAERRKNLLRVLETFLQVLVSTVTISCECLRLHGLASDATNASTGSLCPPGRRIPRVCRSPSTGYCKGVPARS